MGPFLVITIVYPCDVICYPKIDIFRVLGNVFLIAVLAQNSNSALRCRQFKIWRCHNSICMFTRNKGGYEGGQMSGYYSGSHTDRSKNLIE